jgi:HJR/Mrr/RecB family endonuclease
LHKKKLKEISKTIAKVIRVVQAEALEVEMVLAQAEEMERLP